MEDKFPYAIFFINKNLSKAKLNDIAIEKDLLAIMHSLKRFKHYITRYQVFVHIDLATIKYLMKKPNFSARIIRWLLLLQQKLI